MEKVKSNTEVKNLMVEFDEIDNLAILEGAAKYKNDNKSVETTIRIKGEKAQGKMDI